MHIRIQTALYIMAEVVLVAGIQEQIVTLLKLLDLMHLIQILFMETLQPFSHRQLKFFIISLLQQLKKQKLKLI